ncbi:MAG: aspartate aminotransferase family protein [bacterium]|nr:aspartate aminotransferase family protein [bacterium]
MNSHEFRKEGHRLVDWMADYLDNLRDLPVRSTVAPGEIINEIPTAPPITSEPFDKIFSDFQQKIMPGMTHWQHPSFFAYFPANSSAPSVLAEMLTATLGAQCMIWQTSPAAAELEERMMQWLGQMLALPGGFTGVIQDTASTASLCAILTARERKTDFRINECGFSGHKFSLYCSTETHSSIEKGVKIAGFGRANLRQIAVDDRFAMIPSELEKAILQDKAAGFTPLCVIATIGTTGSTAIDPLKQIGDICVQHGIWLHVDAAYAGTALLLPEMRWMSEGLELADSFVFNPHKWMLTNFDCSAYFVRDREALIRTFEILPEYLKTAEADRVNNYRDWGIPLGRRFRALKLWFVIRSFGVEGLQKLIRQHISLAQWVAGEIRQSPDFELLAPHPLSLVCFRYHPGTVDNPEELNQLNAKLLADLNGTGKLYMTHTKLRGAYTLRMVIGQSGVTRHDVESAWDLIQTTARSVR